jgi:hypothetical protein
VQRNVEGEVEVESPVLEPLLHPSPETALAPAEADVRRIAKAIIVPSDPAQRGDREIGLE